MEFQVDRRKQDRLLRSVLHAERHLEVPDFVGPRELIGEANHFIRMDPHVEIGEVMADGLFARVPGRSDEFLVDVDIGSSEAAKRHAVEVRVEEFAEGLLALAQRLDALFELARASLAAVRSRIIVTTQSSPSSSTRTADSIAGITPPSGFRKSASMLRTTPSA